MAVGPGARYVCGDEERRAALQRAIGTGVVINGIRCDLTTATWIYTSPAGNDYFTGDGFRRFDDGRLQLLDYVPTVLDRPPLS